MTYARVFVLVFVLVMLLLIGAAVLSARGCAQIASQTLDRTEAPITTPVETRCAR